MLDGGAALTRALSWCNLPWGLSNASEHKGCVVWKQQESNLYKSLLKQTLRVCSQSAVRLWAISSEPVHGLVGLALIN